MIRTAIILGMAALAAQAAEGTRNHAVTMSAGIPGLLLPELGYEYALSESDRIGLSIGTIWIVPEARVSYIRLMRSFELTGSLGTVGALSDDDFGILSTDDPLIYVSATGGYRYSSSGGFIFRIAGGGALFIWEEGETPVPFGQIGVGYGF
jgi:hypothetical protein